MKVNEAVNLIKLGKEDSETIIIVDEVSTFGAARLANCLKGNRSVKRLCLNNCKLSDNQMVELSPSFKHTQIRTLSLGTNNIAETGAKALANGLESSSVNTLFLYANKFDDLGTIALAEKLIFTNLVNLDLRTNNIGIGGITALAKGLKGTTVEDLYLSENLLTDEHILQFCAGIPDAFNLKRLDLENNPEITDLGAQYLINATRTHRSLRVINLNETSVSENLSVTLENTLSSLHTKRTLLLLNLLSPRIIPRLGKYAPIRYLNPDLIKKMLEYISDCYSV